MQPLSENGLPNVALERQWMLGLILHGEKREVADELGLNGWAHGSDVRQ